MKRIIKVSFIAGVGALVIGIATPTTKAQENRKSDGQKVAQRKDVRQH